VCQGDPFEGSKSQIVSHPTRRLSIVVTRGDVVCRLPGKKNIVRLKVCGTPGKKFFFHVSSKNTVTCRRYVPNLRQRLRARPHIFQTRRGHCRFDVVTETFASWIEGLWDRKVFPRLAPRLRGPDCRNGQKGCQLGFRRAENAPDGSGSARALGMIGSFNKIGFRFEVRAQASELRFVNDSDRKAFNRRQGRSFEGHSIKYPTQSGIGSGTRVVRQ